MECNRHGKWECGDRAIITGTKVFVQHCIASCCVLVTLIDLFFGKNRILRLEVAFHWKFCYIFKC